MTPQGGIDPAHRSRKENRTMSGIDRMTDDDIDNLQRNASNLREKLEAERLARKAERISVVELLKECEPSPSLTAAIEEIKKMRLTPLPKGMDAMTLSRKDLLRLEPTARADAMPQL